MDDLYRDYILEHYRRPHNFGVLDEPTAKYEGANPLCGDRATVYLTLEGDKVKDAGFVRGRQRETRRHAPVVLKVTAVVACVPFEDARIVRHRPCVRKTQEEARDFVPADAVRSFLTAQAITLETGAASAADHAAMEKSVMRVICVRK